MLTNHSIVKIIREIGLHQKHDINLNELKQVEMNHRSYSKNELMEFKRDLVEAGNQTRVIFMEYGFATADFNDFLRQQSSPVVVFREEEGALTPLIILPTKKSFEVIRLSDAIQESFSWAESISPTFFHNEKEEIICLATVTYDSPVSNNSGESEEFSPVKRLIRLLSTERRDIFYILFYAVIVGIVSLALPLGIQTTVELISGGVVFSSVYLMIGLVILGVLLAGVLQMVQISMVEFLQRRVFTKAALEFAFRIPRLQLESLSGKYAPELVNRFFDVMTVQKGLPKLLIDLSSAIIQILFGLFLISLYHPFFVFFGLILLTVLGLIFYATGPRGLRSSINESKYKYKVAQWLEELARTIVSFKLGGNSDLPIRQTDYNVNNYLKNRKVHFNTLLTQFSFIIIFKAAITGGLLIVGTILVVGREITLGQFVASEIVIILILSAVEKIIMYMDVVYDLLTAVDKIAHVTDLPIERVGGLDFPSNVTKGFKVEAKNLSYSFSSQKVLSNVNIKVESGEHVCIAGPGGAGKTVLTNILTGMYSNFQGIATLDNYSLRDLDLTHLREKIGKNISPEDIFEGTLLENLTVGNAHTSVERVMQAIDKIGLNDVVNALPKGLSTQMVSGGKGFPDTFIQKIILTRCLAKQPRLLVLNDFFTGLSKTEKLKLINCVFDRTNSWTLIAVSNDPLVMAALPA
ncbi:MAG: ATP-binding cassette domain-containing protein, partial [Cyclobacteriaceae bacterium]|nr:ATP-binding cassette domain-containing protein [Cyclobacteriaceae bacterium]